MFFLVIGTAKRNILPETDHLPGIAESGLRTIAYVQDLEKQGKLKFAAPFGEEWGGVMIFDVPSYDELSSLILMFPATMYYEWKVRPLATWDGLAQSLAKYRDVQRERLAQRNARK